MRTLFLATTLIGVVLAATGMGTALSATRPAGPAVVVHLQSGRTLSGQVDPATNEREFVLRSSVGPGLIQRPIQWERLAWAEIVGEQISGPELQRLVSEIRLTVKARAPQPSRDIRAKPQQAVAQEPRMPRAL
jgi:hypothetical protein